MGAGPACRDQRIARQRIKGMLLRLGHRYSGKTGWTPEHLRYLASVKLSHAAQQIALQEYIEAVTVATERLARLTKAVEAALPGWRCEKVVRALMSLRGVAVINAMTLVADQGHTLSAPQSFPILWWFRPRHNQTLNVISPRKPSATMARPNAPQRVQ